MKMVGLSAFTPPRNYSLDAESIPEP